MPFLMLGTRNRKKREEIVEILGDLPIEFGDLNDRLDVPEVDETGATFEENARLKAVAVARATGEWSLGEDSGLVVPALDGRPGIYSARFAGTQGDDAANNNKLLTELALLPAERRAAYYVCLAVLADPSGEICATAEGRCHGVIATETARLGWLRLRSAIHNSRVPQDVWRTESCAVKHAD